ncbi:hypothetical protein HG536_0H04320 [Torulaspora globosa]|uniref:sphingosine kinase n=1 Tax=Torulaspora globosa TaxID=48254 RepID=A0A7G3ZNH0_9SACH|nr:uncharacterized protein HG536_0H04320 [Torulaspora globosa]QLL35056.1 hypothetical protein HG536_0H04320 [Torulaspora globosa]
MTLRSNSTKLKRGLLLPLAPSSSTSSTEPSFDNSDSDFHKKPDRSVSFIDSRTLAGTDNELHTNPLASTTTKNIHVSMNLPSSLKSLRSIAVRDFNEATLTDDGIMITSQGISLASRASDNEAFLDSRNNSTSDSSFFETESLVSCVTCLSDSYSTEQRNHLNLSSPSKSVGGGLNNLGDHDASYSSVTGQMLANTVIPYGRILHAKYLENPKDYLDNTDTSKASDASSSPSSSNLNDSDNQVNTAAAGHDDRFLAVGGTKSGINTKGKTKKCSKRGSGEPKFVEITFAKPRRHDIVPKRLILSISFPSSSANMDIVEEILKRSYKNARRERSILVIINPFGGKRKAKKLFMSKCKPILLASKCSIDTAYTKYFGHAVDIAREVDIDKYDTIACASGDGIPYEVINGLFQRPDRAEAFNKLAVTQLPCGSGNAMSVSCHWTNNPSYAALCLVKSVEARIDLMCCSQQSYYKEFPRLSFLSQTYGVIAESDINTEFIRWMGPARFELGVAFNVLQRKKYPCEIYVKYAAKLKNDLKVHYLEHKNRASLRFESELERNQDHEGLDGDSNSRDADRITEKDFKVKYPLDNAVPADWERIDPDLTDNLGIFYTGKMPYIAADTKFFPAALPADGSMDLVITDARTPVTRMAPILLGLDKGSHVLQPEVIHSKILAYRLVPKITNSLFSVDGEKFPLEPLQVEVMPRLCKTLLRNGSYVDTDFDSM